MKALQVQSLNLERGRERKMAQTARLEADSNEAQSEIGILQARIAANDEQAKELASKICGIDEKSAAIQTRLNQLTAQRICIAANSAISRTAPMGTAECLTHTLNALQGFEHLDPAGQAMLRAFIQHLDQLRTQ